MTPELTVLTLAALLQLAQLVLMATLANLELGFGKTLNPRDPGRLGKPLQEMVTPRTGRTMRALNNHFEALILFTIAVVVITLSDQSTPFTAACAWVYLGARVAYVPAYVFGWVPWRSFIWSVGFAATGLMLGAALL